MSTISTLDASSGAPSNEQFHGMSDLAPISTTHVISQSAVGSNNVPVQEDDQSVHNRGDCVVGNQEGSKNADADDEENDVLHGSSRSIVWQLQEPGNVLHEEDNAGSAHNSEQNNGSCSQNSNDQTLADNEMFDGVVSTN